MTSRARTTSAPRARTGRRVDPEREAEVLAHHAAGETRNAIARAVDLAPSTVSRIVREAGLGFDRSATAVATKAKAIDQRAERTRRAGSLLMDLPWLQQQLREAEDARALADVSKALLNVTSAHARLAAIGEDDGAATAMDGLGRLMAAITLAADEPYRDPNTVLGDYPEEINHG